MADILIKHLELKSKEHLALGTLKSQWDFDSKLIPKALQAIGSLFPHYSRHDESHSRQILINIERILGSSVSLLSATDTWLLLEAAYWHDIGMVVPQQDIAREIQSDDFRDYLESIKSDVNHDLNRFAHSFSTTDMTKCFVGADNPTDATARFNELVAEWFRRKHPSRADRIVRSPWDSAGLSSPRTELMPTRIFRVLGRICQMHGEPFETIISEAGLPFREAGMANEDCHPRFVACLLRLGDLLDLDDNRFCPVLQKIAGDGRPSVTRAHEEKHLAIRHLRIDRDLIEVSAECQTIPGYLETFKWFDWLKKEIQDQMSRWNEIAPNRDLGLLPTLGALKVTLNGELQILQEGRRPQFGVDERSVLKLVQGSNLYDSAFPCIRELLQNAVDATLLSLWAKDYSQDLLADAQSIGPLSLSDTRAYVAVELIELDRPPDNTDKSKWILRISDQGTGISKDDLLHMLKVGGSQKNEFRQRIIRNMPEWMKPSGAFGIGLQSAFMLSDSIRIKTKSIFSNETMELVLHSPVGPNDGLIQISHLTNEVAQPCGTSVELEITLDRFSQRWHIGPLSRRTNSFVKTLVNSLDPVLDVDFPFDAGVIADQVASFGENSLIRVDCAFKPINGKISEISSSGDSPSSEWRYISDAAGHCLRINYIPSSDYMAFHNSEFYYRGQKFECRELFFPNVLIRVDILSGSAGNWISANRDKLTPKAASALEESIISALDQVVAADIHIYARSKPKNWIDLSIFLHAMSFEYKGNWSDYAGKTGDAWLEFTSAEKILKGCFDKIEWYLGRGDVTSTSTAAFENLDFLVPGTCYSIPELATNKWISEDRGSVQTVTVRDLAGRDSDNESEADHYNKINGPDFTILKFSNQAGPIYSDSALAFHLHRSISAFSNRRFILETSDERWGPLGLKDSFNIRASWLIQPKSTPDKRVVILVPFLFTQSKVECNEKQIDRISQYVSSILNHSISNDEIRSTYINFIDYIDNEVMPNSQYAESWRKSRLEAQ